MTSSGIGEASVRREVTGYTLSHALTHGVKGDRIELRSIVHRVNRYVVLGRVFTLPSSYHCRYYQFFATRGQVQGFRVRLACAIKGNSSWKSVDLLADYEMLGNSKSQKWSNPKRKARLGSGFFVTRQGHVFTSAHVVRNCLKITVTDSHGAMAEASVVGMDEVTDTAVIITKLKSNYVVHPYSPSSDVLNESVKVYGMATDGSDPANTVLKPGTIRRLVGYDNNPIVFTMDLNLDHGSSGGPVILDGGHLLGIVHAADRHKHNTSYAVWGGILMELMDRWGIPSGNRRRSSSFWSTWDGVKASVSIRCNLLM